MKNLSVKKFVPGITWFFIVTILCCLPSSGLPKVNNWLERIYFDKWVHMGLFGALGFLFMHPLVKSDLSNKKKQFYFILIFLLTCLWGLAIEYIQKYFIRGRGFDWADWAADSVGAAATLILCIIIIKNKNVSSKIIIPNQISVDETFIDNIISTLAKSILRNENSYEELARKNAQLLRGKDLKYLIGKFHNPPSVPPDINAKQLKTGQWLSVSQYAIFELIYNLDAEALDILKTIAFGEYDWTQATALEMLCRLYIDGKISDTIMDEINDKLSNMRYETHLYLAQDLLTRKERDNRFDSIFKRIKNPLFHKAVAEINSHKSH